MKTATKLALIGALGYALGSGATYAQTGIADQPPANPPGGPPHVRFDSMLQQLLDKYDANKDGQLDPTELATLKQDLQDGKVAPPGLGRGPRGPGGPGGLGGPRGPRGPLPQDILDKYDANKDGVLDEMERAALQQDIRDGKVPPPHFGAGPQGPGGGPGLGLPKDLLDKYDVNKDGVLDETERAALQKDIADGKVQPPPRHRPPGPGFALSAQQVMAKFDQDKDGKLDETELSAFINAMKMHRPGLPPGGPPAGEIPTQQ